MATANYWYLYHAFISIERSTIGEGVPLDFNPNSEESVKTAYESFVVPWFSGLRDAKKVLFRISLAYFLKKESFTGRVVLTKLQDFELRVPEDERLLFVWLWESVFPDQSIDDIDTSDVCEVNDPMELNDFF